VVIIILIRQLKEENGVVLNASWPRQTLTFNEPVRRFLIWVSIGSMPLQILQAT